MASNQESSSVAPSQSAAPPKQEFVVKVPKKHALKKYSILKFNGMDNVDPSKWTAESRLHMERQDNRAVVMSNVTAQDYGEGSEYGRAAREEARRKKYGRLARNYNIDNQPWRLSFVDQDNRERKMRGIRENPGENADYWVFLKSGEEFHAYKVDNWHKFLPIAQHKTLDIDQAEEQFLQRHRVMNQFALQAQIKNKLKGELEDGDVVEKTSKSLKIKDGVSSDEDEEGGSDEGERADATTKVEKDKKKKPKGKERKDKRTRVENEDDVAKYESSDGEDEGREYDYMTDSGSDSEREMEPSEEKIEKELVGVDDEEGLKQTCKKTRKDLPSSLACDSSGSDTDDDPDEKKFDPALFLAANTNGEDVKPQPGSSGGGASASSSGTNQGVKRANEAGPSNGGTEAKKAKVEEKPKFVEGLNEETVRKYLRRKPHTTKELLTKMRNKCGDMSKPDIVSKLAAILKAIDPHQFKQKQGKKEVLFFSLTNQAA
ncbi:hypothetical protein WR25_04437 [Diploscapter pachys]|uniref:Transcription initiation factor IIF subunit alpha n=1 Tax=Diploscapter pachys TaxID=2018661 RepID=A0A2A2LG13_9BILA|nr:hypothetical protein WR25_04437 [Diploscapter pachys]